MVIKTLDPDPHLETMLDPDPHQISADPKAWYLVFFCKPDPSSVWDFCLPLNFVIRYINKDAPAPNQLLSLRILTNMFSTSEVSVLMF